MTDNALERGNVLIVDDTLANMRLLTQMLREQGYKVRGAPNGDIALNAVRSAPPDVLLLDINMPGKNGYEVCRELKADDATRHIPIIFLSALDEPLDKVAAFEAGGADYVAKPFQIEEVLARVEHQLELRRLQQDLVEARIAAEAASQAKSAFLANMSHEIRTPMNAILGYAQIMGDDAGLSELQRKAVDTIESSGQHLLAIINDILDLSKVEAGREDLNEEVFELTDFVRDLSGLFEMRCEQKGLTWRLEIDVGHVHVRGDQKKLRQTLVNLLGNAIKFTQSGQVSLALRPEGEGCYLFEVEDTGPGIAADRQQRVFEPFQQDASGLKHGGTGLGLAIVRRHLDLMGGTICLDSEEGKGARFSVVLPLPDGAPASAPATALWDGPCRLVPGQEVRALVVDDVETNRELLDQMLTGMGVGVESADGGPQALELSATPPDIALIDIGMPDMNGIELLQALVRRHGADSFKAVAVSASAMDHQQLAFLQAGFDAFIGKPLRREQICKALTDLLDVDMEPIAETEPATAADRSADADDLGALSTEHLAALREAVTGHNMTRLRQVLVALEQEGHAATVARLRELGDRYDFVGLRGAVEGIDEI